MAKYRVFKDRNGLYSVSADLSNGGINLFRGSRKKVTRQDLSGAVLDLAKQLSDVREKHKAVRDGAGIAGVIH